MSGPKRKRTGPVALAELVGPVIDPVTARRGFATADLLAVWPEIVGAAYAGCTAPEKIAWPRSDGDETPGVLFLRVDGPRAIFVQHELPLIRQRVNAFFGYAAIGQIRIVQAPVAATRPSIPDDPTPLPADAEDALAGRLTSVEDDQLRAALDRLGRGVLSSRRE